jgi:hypothetical protein
VFFFFGQRHVAEKAAKDLSDRNSAIETQGKRLQESAEEILRKNGEIEKAVQGQTEAQETLLALETKHRDEQKTFEQRLEELQRTLPDKPFREQFAHHADDLQSVVTTGLVREEVTVPDLEDGLRTLLRAMAQLASIYGPSEGRPHTAYVMLFRRLLTAEETALLSMVADGAIPTGLKGFRNRSGRIGGIPASSSARSQRPSTSATSASTICGMPARRS